MATESFHTLASQMGIEEIASRTLDCAFRVHSQLGPGLLESTYEACLSCELTKAGLRALRQVPQPILYDSLQLDEGYRLDLLVEDSVVIEIKAVERLIPVHHLQLKTYLKLSGKTLGFLINFNVPLLKDGLHRIVLNHPENRKNAKTAE